MIKSIDIENYEAHKKSHIEFSPGVTVITGPSDSGKTSIFRFFKWIKENRPLGNAFENWDMKSGDITSGKISFDNATIFKARINGSNSYSLEIPSKFKGKSKKTNFDVVKQDIPEEIVEVFNMSDVNIQSQHGAYFLIDESWSAGKVAEKFNDLAGLNIFDRIFSNINSYILKSSQAIKSYKKSYDELEACILELDYIDTAKAKVEAAQTLIKQSEELIARKDKIAGLCERLRRVQESQKQYQEKLKAEHLISPIKELIQKYNDLTSKVSRIKNIVERLKTVRKSYANDQEWLSIEKHAIAIADSIKTSKENESKLQQIQSKVLAIKRCKQNIEAARTRLENHQKTYKTFLEKHNICPVCGGNIDENCIRRIVG